LQVVHTCLFEAKTFNCAAISSPFPLSVELCAGVSGSEEGGLDLLASLLGSEEEEADPQPHPSSGRKRKGEEMREKGEKRRRVGSSGGGSGELAVEDRMAEMSGMELRSSVTCSLTRQFFIH